jgi:hypothetical protein
MHFLTSGPAFARYSKGTSPLAALKDDFEGLQGREESTFLYARELGGCDFFSFNLLRLRSGEARPKRCEMASSSRPRILKAQLKGRLKLADAERARLGEIGHRLGRKVLAEVATVARPDTIWPGTASSSPANLMARKSVAARADRGSGARSNSSSCAWRARTATGASLMGPAMSSLPGRSELPVQQVSTVMMDLLWFDTSLL